MQEQRKVAFDMNVNRMNRQAMKQAVQSISSMITNKEIIPGGDVLQVQLPVKEPSKAVSLPMRLQPIILNEASKELLLTERSDINEERGINTSVEVPDQRLYPPSHPNFYYV
jgi:hypothetical protein